MKRLCSRLMFASATLLVAWPTWAAPTSADKETARTLLREGDQRAREKDEPRALAAYRAADEIMNVPTTGIEVARSLERMGQLLEARDKYLAVKALARPPDEPAVMDKARQSAEEAQKALLPRIPSVRVEVTGVDDVKAVRLRVDDVTLPVLATLLPRRVNPGKHVLIVSAPGYSDERVEVTVVEGEAKAIPVVLERGTRSFAPSEPTGPVTPAKPTEPPAPRTEPPATTGTRRSPLVYAALATGAVGVGVGAVTGILAFSRTSAAKDQCTGNVCLPAAQSDIDASKTFGTISTVAFGVGLVGLGVGTYLFFSSRGSARAASAPPAWTVAPGLGSVAFGGTFR